MKKRLLQIPSWIFIFLSLLVSFLIYKSSLEGYFFQDDWFTLRISKAVNLQDFLGFFVPRNDVIYYRPLGMQLPFFILQSLFGVNALPFHILIFSTHAINILLVYLLIYLIKKDKLVAALSAFLYGVSAVHYIPMFWPATYAFLSGPLFFFLSFILFIKYRYFLSFSFFILGLLTNEMIIVLPAVLFLYSFYLKKLRIKRLLPFFLAAVLIFVVRFLIFTPPVKGSYQLGLGKEILINLKAYLLWSFNWPEEIKAQFTSFFKVNQQFIKDFGDYFWKYMAVTLINITLMFIIPGVIIILKKKRNILPVLFLGLAWFVVALTPVLFFSQHSYSYYLPISLVGMLLAVISLFKYMLEEIYAKNSVLAIILVFLLLGSWTYSSAMTVEFNSKIHWAKSRAKLSKSLIDEIKKNDRKQFGNEVIVNYTSENKYALNDQDALKIIYNDDKLITVYENDPLNQKL